MFEPIESARSSTSGSILQRKIISPNSNGRTLHEQNLRSDSIEQALQSKVMSIGESASDEKRISTFDALAHEYDIIVGEASAEVKAKLTPLVEHVLPNIAPGFLQERLERFLDQQRAIA